MTAAIALRERPPRYRRAEGLRESELSRLWEAQRLPPEALVTASGDEVHVVYRGRRGAGPGPDFRDAVIGTNDASLLKGDVELHVRSSDFRRHGHHTDRAYLRLALHVVFEDDGGPTELLDGRIVPVVALGQWVQRRAGELRAVLTDPADYQEPCHTAAVRLGAERARTVLTDLGDTRLRQRAARLLPMLEQHGAEQSLYLAVARALGLSRNCAPMEAIAAAMPLAELRAIADAAADPELAVHAALLGTGGLLGGQLTLWPGDGGEWRSRLLAAWHATGGLPLKLEWSAGLQRPGCAPADRLAGLAALVSRGGPPLDATLNDWQTLLRSGWRALLESVQVKPAIGRDRAIEIAVNAVLPWLLAAFAHDDTIAASVQAIYRELPGPPYGKTNALTKALLDDTGTSLVRGAAAGQGALQMVRDWCTQGGCGRCPLS